MGRGAKPQSTALKILRGNPGKRKLNLEEPSYVEGAPTKPSWLDAAASEEWQRLTQVMGEAHLLTTADAGVLLSCCLAYSQLKVNELAIQKYKSDAYKTTDLQGNTIYRSRPEAMRREVARRQYVSFLAEMGQTTVSKTKVKTIPRSQPGGVKRLLG
jgi:P27 family predicted phage terminase small subunit